MRALPRYAELHCRSNYSFLTAASHLGELIEQAKQLGYEALALTDRSSLAGVVRALDALEKQGLPLIIGSEMRLSLPSVNALHWQPADVEGPNLRTVSLRESAPSVVRHESPQGRSDPVSAKVPKKLVAPTMCHRQPVTQVPNGITPQAAAQAVITAAQPSAASMARVGLPLARAKTGSPTKRTEGPGSGTPLSGRASRAE